MAETDEKPTLRCPSCESIAFQQVGDLMLRRDAEPTDTYQLRCRACGTVLVCTFTGEITEVKRPQVASQ